MSPETACTPRGNSKKMKFLLMFGTRNKIISFSTDNSKTLTDTLKERAEEAFAELAAASSDHSALVVRFQYFDKDFEVWAEVEAPSDKERIKVTLEEVAISRPQQSVVSLV